jgi:hypothetical protein
MRTEKENLIKEYDDMAVKLGHKFARNFGRRHTKDFIQEARVLLINAVEKYLLSNKSNKEKSIKGYINHIIRNGLSKVALKLNSDVSVSVSTRELINRIKNSLKNDEDFNTISKKYNISKKRISKLLDYTFNFYSFNNLPKEQKEKQLDFKNNHRQFEILDGLMGIDRVIFEKICENKTITDIVQETGINHSLVKERLININNRIQQEIL